MSGNDFRPRRRKPDAGPLHIVVLRSRNKDNQGILGNGYRERTESFLTREPADSPVIQQRFDRFVGKGMLGETSRCYYSVNERDERMVQRALMHLLIDNDDIDMTRLDQLATSIAAHEECKSTRHVLLDIDTLDMDTVNGIRQAIEDDAAETGKPNQYELDRTINGYHMVCERGFDPSILNGYGDVEIKRDAYRLIASKARVD